MSTSIDQRVVQMRFDNKDFEKNVNSTISVLDKLKEKLTFKKSAEELDKLQTKVDKVNFDTLSNSADKLSDTLTTKVIAKLTIVHEWTQKIYNAAETMVKSLTLDQVSSGFSKYEQKLANTQGIINATGKSLEEVNVQLDKLMWYTDETSYSFLDMANTISRFTSYGIDLETAVTAIIGIGNAAGLAGASIQDASHAMSGFAKAIGTYMSRQDWQWIQTAHMDTKVFKEQLMQTAAAIGTLKKAANGAYHTLEGTEVTIESFETTLSEKWLTGDTLLGVLKDFGSYSEGVYKLYQNGIQTGKAMDILSGQFSEVSEKGMRASQECKTFGDALSAIKDAISSGWMQTSELIFGNFDEARDLWSLLYDELYDIFVLSGEARNELLGEWKSADSNSLQDFMDALYEAWTKLKDVIGIVKQAFGEMFPPVTLEALQKFTAGMKDFVAQFQLSAEAAYTLKVILKGLMLPFRLGLEIIQNIGKALNAIVTVCIVLVNVILTVLGNAQKMQQLFQKIFGDERGLRFYNALSGAVGKLGEILRSTVAAIIEFGKKLKSNTTFMGFVNNLIEGIKSFGSFVFDAFINALDAFATGEWSTFFNSLGSGFSKLTGTFGKFGEIVNNVAQILFGFFSGGISLGAMFIDSVKNFGHKVLSPFVNVFDALKNVIARIGENTMNLFKAIKDFVDGIDMVKVLISGFGASLIILVFQVSRLTGSIAKVISGFSNLGEAATNFVTKWGNVGSSISNLINSFRDKMYQHTIRDIIALTFSLTAAIVILSYAAYKLGEINTGSMMDASAAIGILMATIASIALIGGVVVAKIPEMERALKNFTLAIFGICASVLALAAAMVMLDHVKIETLGERLMQLLLIFALVAGMSAVSGIISKGKVLEGNIKTLIGIIVALAGLVMVLNRLNPDNILPKVILLYTALKALQKTVKELSFVSRDHLRGVGSMITLAIALGILAGVFNMIGRMIVNDPIQAILGWIGGLAMVYAVLIPLLNVTNKAGEHAKDAGSGVLNISKAVSKLVLPIIILGHISTATLIRGGAIAGAILGVLTILDAAFAWIAQKFNRTGKVVEGLDRLASAVTMLVVPIVILGYLGQYNPEAIWTGIGMVSALIVLMGAISALHAAISKESKDKNGTGKVKNNLMSMIAAIGIFTAAIALISLLPWQQTLAATGMMSLVIISFGAAVKLMEKGIPKQSLQTVVMLGSLVAAIAAVFFMFKDLKDWKQIVSITGGLSMVIISFGAAIGLMTKKVKGKDVQLATADWKQLGVFILAAGVTLLATIGLSKLVGAGEETKLLATATSLSLIIAALGVAVRAAFVTKDGEKITSMAVKDATGNLALIGEFIAAALIMLFGVEALSTWFAANDPNTVITNTLALSMIIVALGGAMKLMSGINSSSWKRGEISVGALAATMGILIAGATGAVAALNALPDTLDAGKLMTKVGALIAVMESLAVAMVLINLLGIGNMKDINTTAIAAIAVIMGVLVGAMVVAAVALSLMPDSDLIVQKSLSLAIALIAIAGVSLAMGFLSKAAKDIDIGSVVKVAGMFIIGVAAIAIAVMAVIGLVALIDTIFSAGGPDYLNRGLTVIGEIGQGFGQAIGKFFGGIVDGFKDASTEHAEEIMQRVANSMMTLGEAVEAINNIGVDLETLTKLGLIKMVADYARDLAFSLVAVDTGKFNSFTNSLGVMMEDMISFVEDTEELDVTKIGVVSDAMMAMAEVVYRLREAKDILGNLPDLTEFGSTLVAFAPYAKKFAVKMSDDRISPEVVDSSTNAALAISGFATNAWNIFAMGLITHFTGGLLTSFGSELSGFADGFVEYAAALNGISTTNLVSKSSTAGEAVASLITSGLSWQTVLAFIAGDSLSTIGTQIKNFATGFKKYADTLKEIDVDKAKKATNTIKEILDTIADSLPSKDGVFTEIGEWFLGGEMDLTEYGELLEDFGNGFKKFYNKVKSVDTDVTRNVIQEARDIVSFSNDLDKFNAQNLIDYKDALSNLGDFGVEEFTKALEKGNEYFLAAGGKMIIKIADGIKDTHNRQELRNAITEVCSAIYYSFDWTLSQSDYIGRNIISGIMKGMRSGITPLKGASTATAAAIIDYMATELDIHSPSRVAEDRIGKNVMLGVANGMSKNAAITNNVASNSAKSIVEAFGETKVTNMAEKAGKTLGETIADAVSNGIYSGITDSGMTWIAGAAVGDQNGVRGTAAGDQAKTIIDEFRNYLYDTDNKGENWKTFKKIRNNVKDGLISIAEYQDAYDELSSIETVHMRSEKAAEKKLEILNDLMAQQAIAVVKAETKYVQAVEEYGISSKEGQEALEAMTEAQLQARKYEQEIEELNNLSQIKVTEFHTNYISTAKEAIAAREDLTEEEAQTYLDTLAKLQDDIADGIINDPTIIDAISNKWSEALSIFSDMTNKIEREFSIQDKEYQLWEATVGADASDVNKLNKQITLKEQELSSHANKVRIAEAAYNKTVAALGADSDEAQEQYEDLLDTQIEFANVAKEYSTLLNDLSTAQQEAANANLEAAKKNKTAEELAAEEFEEWRKDGSLKEWYDFGATDEELMSALIDKYNKQKKEEAEAEVEVTPDFVVSSKEITNTMNKYLQGIDTALINSKFEDGLNELVNSWATDFANGTGSSLYSGLDTLSGNLSDLGADIDIPEINYDSIIEDAKKAMEEAGGAVDEAIDLESLIGGSVSNWFDNKIELAKQAGTFVEKILGLEEGSITGTVENWLAKGQEVLQNFVGDMADLAGIDIPFAKKDAVEATELTEEERAQLEANGEDFGDAYMDGVEKSVKSRSSKIVSDSIASIYAGNAIGSALVATNTSQQAQGVSATRSDNQSVTQQQASNTSNTNITYNQYNTSPKALSRYDIKRDTRNLLNSAKSLRGL